MNTDNDLHRLLQDVHRRSYPAYKRLRGSYRFRGFTLSVDHVQGDPFAAPSSLSVAADREACGLPAELSSTPARRVALEDFLLRCFARALRRADGQVGGSGKSGQLGCGTPGPEVLARSACEVHDTRIILRFEAGFPAHGRTTDAEALATMLLDLVPAAVEEALLATPELLRGARAACELADDQEAVRALIAARNLVCFVADGAVLPRASGVSSRPLAGALPFRAPESLAIELDLPHRGRVRGMGVPRGVTVVVGGGFHGKSTLLKAIQEGVYNHVSGDGRELVITDATAVKLRAEDGRAVHGVDISPFIDGLPSGEDTHRFSTANASGSTSQAASTAEALRGGARVLLIDEDTSATNFMVRDELMEAVVSRDHEPITPFAERARALWERHGVSSVIVAGSSGAFFAAARTVLLMDRYEAHDITARAAEVLAAWGERSDRVQAAADFALPGAGDGVRIDLGGGQGGSRGGYRGRGYRGRGGTATDDTEGERGARVKVRTFGPFELSVGDIACDLRLCEQLVDKRQTAAIAQLIRVAGAEGLLDGSPVPEAVAERMLAELGERGWQLLAEHEAPGCGMALPRAHELAAALARYRVSREAR